MKKEKNKINQIIIFLIPAILIILIGTILIVSILNKNKDIKINNIETENYLLKYDETWKIEGYDSNKALLKHAENAQIKIELSDIEEKNKYSELNEIIDEIIYNTNKNNTDYKLVKQEEKNITKNEYDGYRLLYENNENSVIINIFKAGEKLVTITYEAESKYFDILLDSANTIVYNFELKEQTLDLLNEINIETKNIEYKEESIVDELLKETKEYEITSNNYCVKYSIPISFEESGINSSLGIYHINGLKEGNILISTSILNRNIYESVVEGERLNLFKEYDNLKNNEGFEESINKIEKNGYKGYIYKNQYYQQDSIKEGESFINENIKIIYSLNANHIFEITIESSRVSIPEKLVNMISINSAQNYSSYIKNETKDGYLIGVLKRNIIGTDKKTEEITIKIPEKYKELDKEQNIYEYRNYAIDYNDKLEEYNYEIEYHTTTMKEEEIVNSKNNILSKAYGEPMKMTLTGEKNINGKNFKEYNCRETALSGIMYTNINREKYYINTKVLIHQLENGGFLVIEIKGNNMEISEEIVNEVTNFEVKTI